MYRKEAEMAEEETTETVERNTEPGKGEDQPDDLAGLKSALAKEREARRKFEREAKDNADAAKRLQDAEDADKSEVEKFTERATAAEKRAEEAERRAWRLEVAADKGLTPTQAKRLQGSTREELEADADELRKDLGLDKSDTDETDERRRPREKLQPGASNEEDQVGDPAKLAESILKSPF